MIQASTCPADQQTIPTRGWLIKPIAHGLINTLGISHFFPIVLSPSLGPIRNLAGFFHFWVPSKSWFFLSLIFSQSPSLSLVGAIAWSSQTWVLRITSLRTSSSWRSSTNISINWAFITPELIRVSQGSQSIYSSLQVQGGISPRLSNLH